MANIADIIEVSSNTSEVLLGGPNSAAVELRRNGVVLATGAATGTGGEAGLNSDHAPGGCWDGFVPQMLPGDEVHNTTNGDFITVGGVTVTSGPTLENGAVVLRGTVVRPLPAGHDLDAAIAPSDGSRFPLTGGSSGDQFLSAGAGDGGGSITEHGDGTWTARFTGIDPAERQKALDGESDASVGIEHDIGPGGGEVTVFHFGGAPGPHGGCNALQPYAPNEVTGFDRNAINAGNAGSDLVVSGKSQPGVTSVQVTLTGAGGAPVVETATPSGGTWTASLPAGSFADGPVNAAIRMTMAGGQFAGVGKAIDKDTVAPGAPTANVAAGTYQQAVDVSLSGENVRYTTDGSTPTAASRAYSAPVRVDSSQTIKAVSVDGAGNTSPVAGFAYTIQPPAAAAAPAAGAGSAGAPQTAASLAAPLRLRLASLTVARRMTLRSARRSGVSAAIVADGAGAVRVRLRRAGRTIASVVRRVGADGVVRVALPSSARKRRALKRGVYSIEVTPGSSRSSIDGETSKQNLRLR